MKDFTRLTLLHPEHVEGRVTIEYKDPLNGKTKELMRGTNHIYQDSLFGARWKDILDKIDLHITDSRYVLDDDLPYLLGTHTGWGRVGQGSSGTYQGTYNTALSSLGVCSLSGMTWKYVYDFTPSQVPGIVGTIGLTPQYSYWGSSLLEGQFPMSRWQIPASAGTNTSCITVDGRYQYSISSSGVVTKYDLWTAISTTKDILAIVGASGSSKYMGYAPDSGRFYVYAYNSTASSRKMYEFADDSFSSAINTYSTTNGNQTAYFYVYGGIAFLCGYSGSIYKWDYISNTAPVAITLDKDILYYDKVRVTNVHCVHNQFILCMGNDHNNGVIFDMSTQIVAGYISQVSYAPSYPAIMRYPLGEHAVWGHKQWSGSSVGVRSNDFFYNTALAVYRVPDDAPVRPAGYGMTITYEIEVMF